MRGSVPVALAALGAVLWGVGRCAAGPVDVVELKDGHQVVGEVLAEKPGALYVDLGFEVIRIPRDQVVGRKKAGQAAAVAAPTAAAPAHDVDPTGLYQTAPLRPMPVKELVHRFGEAVISIETPSGKGSGFILNDEGYAVTNNHVIEGETRISAILYQNTPSGLVRRRIDNVEIVALNQFVDLALIKLPPQKDLKLGHVFLGSIEEIGTGDNVFAVGNPLGLERSVTQGSISARNRNFEGLIYIQTDTPINPGNSGGPLFNLKGEVVGVTNMGVRGGDNLGFAIPINYVKDFLRNREAFSFDKDNPNTGYRYLDPPRRLNPALPPGRSPGNGSNGETKAAAPKDRSEPSGR